MPAPLSKETVGRIGQLAISDGLGYRETARRLGAGSDGGPPIRITAETVRRNVHRIRAEGKADVRPMVLAGRMLRLLERDLAKLEAAKGELDTGRLDQLAATLRRLEPLQPKQDPSGQTRRPDLRSIAAPDDTEPRPSSEAEGEPLTDLSQLR